MFIISSYIHYHVLLLSFVSRILSFIALLCYILFRRFICRGQLNAYLNNNEAGAILIRWVFRPIIHTIYHIKCFTRKYVSSSDCLGVAHSTVNVDL